MRTQPLPRMGQQGLRRGVESGTQDHGADRHVLVHRVPQGQGGGVQHVGVSRQHGLDLRREDVDAVHDHHVVGTAVIDDLALGREPAQVPRQKPRTLETRGRGRSVVAVAVHLAGTADADQPNRSRRNRLPLPVHDLHQHTRSGLAQGAGNRLDFSRTGHGDRTGLVDAITHVQTGAQGLPDAPTQVVRHSGRRDLEHPDATQHRRIPARQLLQHLFGMEHRGKDHAGVLPQAGLDRVGPVPDRQSTGRPDVQGLVQAELGMGEVEVAQGRNPVLRAQTQQGGGDPVARTRLRMGHGNQLGLPGGAGACDQEPGRRWRRVAEFRQSAHGTPGHRTPIHVEQGRAGIETPGLVGGQDRHPSARRQVLALKRRCAAWN